MSNTVYNNVYNQLQALLFASKIERCSDLNYTSENNHIQNGSCYRLRGNSISTVNLIWIMPTKGHIKLEVYALGVCLFGILLFCCVFSPREFYFKE